MLKNPKSELSHTRFVYFWIIKVERKEKEMVNQLVERIRQKDQRAMSQLYQLYVEELSSVCYRYVPSEDDAKDAFKAWMKQVVANEALSFLKNRKKLLFVEQDQTADEADEESASPDTERISPDELHQLISELPDGYRMVLNLYVFENYSHRQIASLLGIKESTSASQLYYAKKLLTKRIKDLTKDKQ